MKRNFGIGNGPIHISLEDKHKKETSESWSAGALISISPVCVTSTKLHVTEENLLVNDADVLGPY